MSSAQSIAAVDHDLLCVYISRVASEMIARSDDRRAGTHAIRFSQVGTTTCIRLSEADAEQLKEWSLDAWRNAERGQRKTLTSLTAALTDALQRYRVRDCVPDPGRDAIVNARSCGARLSMGTMVVDARNDLVQIISGPDFYKVNDENGRHTDKQGRYDWRYGYMCALAADGGLLATRHFFYPLYRLWSKDDGDITHMRLVSVSEQ
jgi:hypothetical protein